MSFLKKKTMGVKAMILDPSVPFEHRRQILAQLVMHNSDESNGILASILDDATSGDGSSLSKELGEIMKEMQEGPLRFGTFLKHQGPGGAAARAKVRLEDGTTVFPIIPDSGLAESLSRGTHILLDSQGMVVVSEMVFDEDAGEEAQFERRIGSECVEISLRGEERFVFDAAQPLIDALDRGEVEPGSRLLVCSRRLLAFRALPPVDGPAHNRYLVKSGVPDVIVERDIGAPPSYIEQVLQMIRIEMTDPGLRRSFRLRRCGSRLLAGISGSGKSYSLLGLWRKVYELMSEVTGVPMGELPPRIMRIRSAEVVSKWYGETERNIARFVSEVERLADEKFIAPDGSEYTLPIIAILEEIDGLTRIRGEDSINDRVLTTLLDLIDPNRPELKDKLVIFIATTNVPHRIDPAFLRRIGDNVDTFGRLTRNSFISVLDKHLRGLPFAPADARSPEDLTGDAILELTSWLFSPNGEDRGQVELYYAGSTVPEICYRRDFLTAGLIERAVQQASTIACNLAAGGTDRPGLTVSLLKASLDRQFQSVVNQVSTENIGSYLELREGVRVQRVVVMEQPETRLFEMLRAS